MDGSKDATATASSPEPKPEWIDPDDAPELDDAWFAAADVYIGDRLISRGTGPEVPMRGRPRSPDRKVAMSIRLSPEVVEYFRATGPGWQTRIDAALKEWVAGKKG